MCTSIAFKTKNFYFGRNLDLDCAFGERVIITPRNFPFDFRMEPPQHHHYAMIGMATMMEGYPLYAEAVNEKGLGIAGLNFPGNAYYPPDPLDGVRNVSPFELIPWLLGQCANLNDARMLLQNIRLVGLPFHPDMPLSPLHWHIADETGSIVLEATKEGVKIYDNPVGVMTNNPPFDFHMTNLRQYLHLTPADPENQFSSELDLKPFCVGLGAMGLPGDWSSASRFVRAAFLTLNSPCEGTEEASVSRFFHLLDGVAMMDGPVLSPKGTHEVTNYSCCINADKGIFYYKTYTNNQLTAIDMHRENLDGNALKVYPLIREQQIVWGN